MDDSDNACISLTASYDETLYKAFIATSVSLRSHDPERV